MKERIDHVARALELEDVANAIINGAGMAPHMLAVIELDKARLHAQLAMVEQQRIANLIDLRRTFNGRGDGVFYTTRSLDADIASALGVTSE